MQILTLHNDTQGLLSRRSRNVQKPAALQPLVDGMAKAMLELKGIGLAAVQVGQLLRLFIVGGPGRKADALGPGGEELPLQVFVNPRILSTNGQALCWERCLSIPDYNVKLSRPAAVHFTAADLSGYQHEYRWDGLWARVFLHEHDHLRGLTLQRFAEKNKSSPYNDALFESYVKTGSFAAGSVLKGDGMPGLNDL